jgi:hypothetical protein
VISRGSSDTWAMLYFLISINMYIQAHVLLIAEVLNKLIEADRIYKVKISAPNRVRHDSV